MKRLAVATTVGLALVGSNFNSAVITTPIERTTLKHKRNCSKLFTVKMGMRAADAIYSGTKRVTKRELRVLGYIERCQRNPYAQKFVRWYDRHRAAQWRARRAIVPTPYSEVASWYDDAGEIACSSHAYYGVANKTLPCGTKVTFQYHGNRITSIVDDRGPYIGGRDWDLNQNTAAALGFDGVDTVESSIYGG